MSLHPTRFRLNSAGQVWQEWAAMPEAGTPFESLLDDAYWAHVSSKMKPSDVIRVMPDDGAYEAWLRVMDCGRLYARVTLWGDKQDFASGSEQVTVGSSDDYKVEYAGPYHKHRVVRLRDKEVMKTGFGSKEEGTTWLLQHVKALAA